MFKKFLSLFVLLLFFLQSSLSYGYCPDNAVCGISIPTDNANVTLDSNYNISVTDSNLETDAYGVYGGTDPYSSTISINSIDTNGKKIDATSEKTGNYNSGVNAAGVLINKNVSSLNNLTVSGEINSSAKSMKDNNNFASHVNSTGIKLESDWSSISNAGNINITEDGKITSYGETEGQYSVQSYGVFSQKNVTKLDNKGTITSTAKGLSSSDLTSTGVWSSSSSAIQDLINSGKITAKSIYLGNNGLSSSIRTYGVDIFSLSNSLENSGEINAQSEINISGNVETEPYTVGVNINNSNTFTNSGKITSESTINTSDASKIKQTVRGVSIANPGSSIINETSGIISAKNIINATNTVEPSNNYDQTISTYGIEISNSNTNATVENKGTIKAESTVDSKWFQDIYNYGVSITSEINRFKNSGTIDATVNSNIEKTTTVYNTGVFIFNTPIVENDENGVIKTTVNVNNTNAEKIEEAILGIEFYSSENSFITNKGKIEVKLNVPQSINTDDVKIAGIYVDNYSGAVTTVTNTGDILFDINKSGVRAHTLFINDNAKVKLDDKFAIVFGQPNIDPSTNSNDNLIQRPIYVGQGATLDINNTTLVAKIDSRNLKYDKKYYLIWNDNGTVTGQWNEAIEKGYTNPNINVKWAGEDRGENSAVMFTYNAETEAQQQSAIMPVMGSMSGTPIIMNSIVGFAMSFNPYFNPLFIGQTQTPIYFASAVMSDVPLMDKEKTKLKTMWFVPVYTKTKAKDLGFNADSYGFTTGFGGEIIDKLYAGAFVGYMKNDIDFKTQESKDEKQNVFLGGMNFLYFPKPYYVKLLTYGYTSKHDYKGRAGLDYELDETADYKSKGFNVEITGGYIFGDKIIFAPEVGIVYSYHKTNSFTTSVPLNPSLNRVYEPDTLDVVKAIVGLTVKGDINKKLQFYGNARLEQALSNNDISVINYVPGQPKYKLNRDISNTTFVLNGGIGYKLSDKVRLELGSRVDLNGDYQNYTVKGAIIVAI